MKHLVIAMAMMLAASNAFAEDPLPPPTNTETPRPITMEKLLQELRDLDSSTDMEGDHVVGESLCRRFNVNTRARQTGAWG